MVARGHGLDDRRRAVREHTGEQEGGFHLRARDGALIAHAVELPVRGEHRERQQRVLRAADDLRAHRAERLHDAAHRAPRERRVACKRREERLRREQAEEQAQRRAGIARVEHARRFPEAVQAVARHDELRRAEFLDGRAERAHAGDGREAVRRVEEVRDVHWRAAER